VLEDAPADPLVLDEGDGPRDGLAARAAEDVDGVDPLEELGPVQSRARRRRGRVRCQLAEAHEEAEAPAHPAQLPGAELRRRAAPARPHDVAAVPRVRQAEVVAELVRERLDAGVLCPQDDVVTADRAISTPAEPPVHSAQKALAAQVADGANDEHLHGPRQRRAGGTGKRIS
jgi:hypothetical protein